MGRFNPRCGKLCALSQSKLAKCKRQQTLSAAPRGPGSALSRGDNPVLRLPFILRPGKHSAGGPCFSRVPFC